MERSRRQFILSSATLASACALGSPAFAQAPARLTESDPTAQALGYHDDATKVDKTKSPHYAAGEMCGNCALYQGKAGDATGPCPIFAGKLVSSKGWCNSYTKKS